MMSGCSDHKGPANIAEIIKKKLELKFQGEYDHVDVKNDDGVG